jgi:GH35 family endo-1,4-beta-xylanase
VQRALRVLTLLSEAHELGCRVDGVGSQIHGFSADVLVSRLERAPRDDIHSNS